MRRSTRSSLQVLVIGAALALTLSTGRAELRAGGRDAKQTFKNPGVVALVQAIEREDLPKIDAALTRGADINAVGEEGQTPLHWSLLKVGVSVKTIQHLLDRGANPNAPMSNGASPLYLTAGSNRPDLLELFLKNRGDPNILVRNRRTALMDAIASQQEVNLELLLKYGADANLGDTCASTVANGRFDFTVILLEHGLTKDLAMCGRLAQRAVIRDNSPRQTDRKKVFELLAERGVLPPFEEPARGSP